jgi:hypothetical protein
MSKEYVALVALDAEDLDGAQQVVRGWDLGDARLVSIQGPPETWTPEEPEPGPDSGFAAAGEEEP